MRGHYRNKELREFAQECPCCQSCDAINMGQIVMAHSNSIKDGHGMGIKASDVPCYIDNRCHDIVDGRDGKSFTKEQRELIRLRATYKSILWLLETGRLVVGNPPYKD